MRLRRLLNLVFVLSIVTTVSACQGGNVRESLGLKKQAPDEFMVIARPPLNVPPDFNLMPPPKEATRVDNNKVREDAKKALFDSNLNNTLNPQAGTNASRGELTLLNRAKTQNADPEIRSILHKENQPVVVEEESEESFLSRIIEPIRPKEKDPIINADKEEERLRKNKEEGNPVNSGDVPTVDRAGGSVIDQLFE